MLVAAIETPIGIVRLAGDDGQLHAIGIGSGDPCAPATALLVEAVRQLQAYFDGRLRGFDLPLAPAVTARGQALRDAIVTLRYGETASYGALARAAGSSPRAVGQACRRNPFPLIVPCHRVLAATELGNYSAGSGRTTKQWLLDHEGKERADG